MYFIGFSDEEKKDIIKRMEKIEGLIVMRKGTVHVYPKGVELSFQEALQERYILPTLYVNDKNGKKRMWKTWTEGCAVHKTYGQIGKKLITSDVRTYKGVNVGKKNETTAEEQAKRECERDWVKQIDKGYLPECKEGKKLLESVRKEKQRQGGVNTGVTSTIRGQKMSKLKENKNDCKIPDYKPNILPMHCSQWEEKPKVLKYFDFEKGVYVQPKCDGVRCHASVVGDRVALVTRTGEQFAFLSSLREQIFKFLSRNIKYKGKTIELKKVILDGELYAEEICGEAKIVKVDKNEKKTYTYIASNKKLPTKQRFDVISGACRPVRNTPHPLEDQICYHVFDIVDETVSQIQRFEILDELFSKSEPKIKRVPTYKISSVKDINIYHEQFISKYYEGVIIRAADLMYRSKERSLKMRKFKFFEDKDYTIVGVEKDDGVGEEQFVWICQHPDTKKEFRVKPMGTKEQKLVWYDNFTDYIGRSLKIKFQELNKDNIPRFGVGILREEE